MKIISFLLFFLLLHCSLAHAQNLDWAKIISGTGSITRQPQLTADNKGNLFLVGSFNGSIDFDPGPAVATQTTQFNSDIFVARYDANGNYVWSRNISGNSIITASGLAADTAGQLYVCGALNGTAVFGPGPGSATLTSSGSNDMFIAVYSADGALLRVKRIGGTGSDYASAIALSETGDVFLAGNFSGTVDFDPSANTASLNATGLSDVFLARFDSLLNFKNVLRAGGNNLAECTGLLLDSSQNAVLCGNFSGNVDFDPGVGTALSTSAGNTDIFLASYDTSHVLLWHQTMGSANSEYVYDLKNDAAQNIYVTGSFSATLDFDPGPATLTLNASKTDVFLAKYSPAGISLWANRILSADLPQACKLFVDSTGNVLLGGYFVNYQDLDPGPFAADHYSKGEADLLMAKYESDGAYVWSRGFGGNYEDKITGICQNKQGSVYITGQFQDTLDFDPGPGTAEFIADPFSDNNAGFIARYTDLITGLKENDQTGFSLQVSLYPNPCADRSGLIVDHNDPEEISVQLFDVQGQEVQKPVYIDTKAEQVFYSVFPPQPGLYLLSVKTKTMAKTIKLIRSE